MTTKLECDNCGQTVNKCDKCNKKFDTDEDELFCLENSYKYNKKTKMHIFVGSNCTHFCGGCITESSFVNEEVD